ncbi:MAG: alpha/beta hydrolase [Thermodesulfobacteriota bacterium]
MKFMSSALSLILCLMATGCAKNYQEVIEGLDAKEQSVIKHHAILIHKDGKYIPQGNIQELPEQRDIIFEQIQTFLKGGGACDPIPDNKNILIYIHGGLNSEDVAIRRAIKATQQMIPDPQKLACAKTYPIFINWRSGPVTTLGDHYFRIRDGEEDKTAPFTSPIYFLGDLARTVGNTPMAWCHEGYQVINASHSSALDLLGKDPEHLKKEAKENKLVFDSAKDEKNRWNLWRRAVWVVTAPFKIISTPFAFTLGTPAWDNMKRRTHTMFTPQPKDKTAGLQPDGDTRKFLKELNAHVKKIRSEGNQEFELTLMGHSMGGIVLNRALRDLSDDLTEVDNIVYMASADNLQNYLDATIPMIKKAVDHQKKPPQIYNLHLHPENEDREISSCGLAPSGSLLAWIDHTYDTPEYVLQRTSGRWTNIRRVHNLIPTELRENYHFRVFERGSSKKRPQTHGSFDDFNFWDKSFWNGTKEPQSWNKTTSICQ